MNNELFPCRFCGNKPIFYKYTYSADIKDCGCYHSIQLYQAVNENLKLKNLDPLSFYCYIWNTRNEKHNPFVEMKNENNR